MTPAPSAAIGLFAVAATYMSLLGCSRDLTSRQCVTSNDASICVTRDGGYLKVDANRLKPDSTVTFSTPLFEQSDIAVSSDGGIDGQWGFDSQAFIFEGVITVTGTTKDGTFLSGDVTFD